MSGITPLFKNLAALYAATPISHEGLKAVTLAQWALESSRGGSDLARLHLNFGGLKWRSELAGFATPVHYDAHDGPDDYCKFDSLEAFIAGYWRFIARSPYQGWETHAGTPEGYIRFIGPTYCPRAGYVDDVLHLLPEASVLLGGMELESAPAEGATSPASAPESAPESAMETLPHLYVGAGHSNSDSGAVADGVKEAEWMTELRNAVAEALRGRARVATDGVGRENQSLSQSIQRAQGCPDGRIELHLNAGGPGANGVECLSLPAQKPLAQGIAQAIAGVLGIKLRGDQGWKSDTEGQHSSLAFCREAHGVVVECFFLTNPEERATYQARRDEVARAIADALLEHAPSG